jgi:hypothetical protein
VKLRFTILDVLATLLNTNRKIMNEIPPWNHLTAEDDHSSMFAVGRSMFNVQARHPRAEMILSNKQNALTLAHF